MLPSIRRHRTFAFAAVTLGVVSLAVPVIMVRRKKLLGAERERDEATLSLSDFVLEKFGGAAFRTVRCFGREAHEGEAFGEGSLEVATAEEKHGDQGEEEEQARPRADRRAIRSTRERRVNRRNREVGGRRRHSSTCRPVRAPRAYHAASPRGGGKKCSAERATMSREK